jgi:hypothetical protein
MAWLRQSVSIVPRRALRRVAYVQGWGGLRFRRLAVDWLGHEQPAPVPTPAHDSEEEAIEPPRMVRFDDLGVSPPPGSQTPKPSAG